MCVLLHITCSCITSLLMTDAKGRSWEEKIYQHFLREVNKTVIPWSEREREKKTNFHSIKYSGEAEHNITLNRKMEFSLWWRKFTCTKLLQPLRTKRKKRFICGASVARAGIFFSLFFVRIAIDVYCVYCVGSTSFHSQFYIELGLQLSHHMHTAHSDTIHIFSQFIWSHRADVAATADEEE